MKNIPSENPKLEIEIKIEQSIIHFFYNLKARFVK